MTHYEDKCEMCGEVVYSYDYDSGYGEHSYNHDTKKPYKDRNISLPEREYDLKVKVCMECQMKEPSLHSLIKKKRIEWFIDEIESKKKKIKRKRKEIKRLEISIPKIQNELKKFRGILRELINT